MRAEDLSRLYWSRQKASIHRRSDESFFQAKALEHASLVAEGDKGLDCIDIGCGAGELLYYLSDHLSVTTGIDYAESMLSQARNRLGDREISLQCCDIFSYLPSSRHQVWISAQAVNQYLESSRVLAFLDMFAANESARSLYLFDCVDPVRCALLAHGISYRPEDVATGEQGLREWLRAARRTLWRLGFSCRLAVGAVSRDCQAIPGNTMGYGYLPRFWIKAADARGMRCEIVSSSFYEYRYHVVLQKNGVSGRIG